MHGRPFAVWNALGEYEIARERRTIFKKNEKSRKKMLKS